MANPVNHQLLDAATSTGAGDQTRLKGHENVTLFLSAKNLDTANDSLTVELEASADGSSWTNIADALNSDKQVQQSDFTEDPDNAGDYTASLTVSDVAYEFVRPRITAYTDAANGDLTVDGWVMASGNAGSGTRGNPEQY